LVVDEPNPTQYGHLTHGKIRYPSIRNQKVGFSAGKPPTITWIECRVALQVKPYQR
jgi:hypothetical protein